MLILLLVFVVKQTANSQLYAYLLKFSFPNRSFSGLISSFSMPRNRTSQNRTFGRHLASLLKSSGKRLKPTKLRIKLQERTLRCQLKCCSKGFKRSRYGSLHAYLPIDLAVETSQPQIFCKCANISKNYSQQQSVLGVSLSRSFWHKLPLAVCAAISFFGPGYPLYLYYIGR